MKLHYRKALISLITFIAIIAGFFVFDRELVPRKESDAMEAQIPSLGAERWSVQEVGLHNAFVSEDFGFVFHFPRSFGDIIVTTSQLPAKGMPYCEGDTTSVSCAVSFEISFTKNTDLLIYGGVPCVGCELEFKYLAGTLLERGDAFRDAFRRQLPNGGQQVEGRAPFSFPTGETNCVKDCIYKGQIITVFDLDNPYKRVTFFGKTNPEYYKLVQSVELLSLNKK